MIRISFNKLSLQCIAITVFLIELLTLNQLQIEMKQLLGMARQKKGGEPHIKKPVIPEPQQMYDQDQYLYQQSQQDLFGYAQFIGIRIPQEIDLLPIAREGMSAPLPPDWQTQETNDQIFYYNKRTGERTEEHPCDGYYRQLVIRERKKRQKSKQFQNPVGGIGQISQGLNLNLNNRNQQQIVQAPIDPLVKMEQQKRLKKLEQQKKNQFEAKKKQMMQKFEDKKEKLQKQHRNQQQKMKSKYDQEQSNQRKKVLKKMSQKQRQNQDRNQQMLSQFEKQSRKKLQRQLNDKKALQKDKIDRRIKQKKQQIRIRLENEFKKSKRQIDEEYESRLKEMQAKQKSLIKDVEQQSLQNRIQQLKQQIVRNKMKQHAQLLHEERRKQQAAYEAELKEVLLKHEQKVASLQNKKPSNTGQKSSMEQLIKQVEAEQKIKMRELKCQLQVLRQLKRVQNQERAQKIKAQCQEVAAQKIKELSRQQQKIKQKYRERRYQQYQQKMWEAQKRAKQQYLRTLRTLQQKYDMEQEIAQTEGTLKHKQELNSMQTNSIEAMERMISNLNWDEKQLRKQLLDIQSEIDALKSKEQGLTGKLTQNQMHLYKLIQDKIRTRKNH